MNALLMLCQDHNAPILVQPVSSNRGPVVRGLPTNLRKRARKAPKHVDKIMRRIECRIAEGRTRDAAKLARLLSHSHDAKLLAVQDANKKLPRGRRVRGAEVHRIAAELDLRQSQGAATYRPEPKPKGGFRPVIDFTLPARAAQRLLKRVIRPFLRIRSDQFAVENGNAPAEGRRILNLVAQGHVWCIEGDIANCYATANPEGVKGLPGGNLKKMMEANALSRSVEATIRTKGRRISPNDLSNLQQQVRAGIPQGSSLSPLLAEAVIASVLDDAERHSDWPEAVHLTCHADNIAVLGRTKADVESAADILREAFKRSRFGPLKLLCKDARSIRQGFDFLGIRYIAKKRRIRPEVSPASRSACVAWISGMVQDYSISKRMIQRRVGSWGAAMGLRQDGRPLTSAAQWANAVCSYALDRQLRGRDLHAQARWHHRALHDPTFVFERW